MIFTVIQVPGKPGRPEVDRVNGRHVSLHWAAPDNDGGTKVTHYIIHYGTIDMDLHDFKQQKIVGTETSCTVSKWIRFNKTYNAVVAENQEGRGPLSDFSEYVRTPTHDGKYL